MNEILEAPYNDLIGKWITYWGSESSWYGQDFLIVDQGRDNKNKIAFLVNGKIEWRTLGASFSAPFDKTESKVSAQVVDNFLNPHAQSKRIAEAEIDRLKKRIAELEAAVKVLDSL